MLKKSRLNKKVLTAMIMATLCSSSAYAMPTGGTVVSGNVTNVANPAELMTANANSIINWNSFSIAVGEKVSFDTRNFMVLNRVVGGQESQLLGMLSDQGNGKLILINPNGIVIGDNAIINVNDLTLSTLSLTDSNFQKLINGETVEFSEFKDGKISIGSNANLTLGEALRLYGGKITIADGVEIVSKENVDTNIQMIASNGVVTNFKNSTLSYVGADKSIEIGKATIGTMNNSVSNVDIRADKLSLDGTSIVVNGKDNKVHDIFISGNDANIKNSSLLNRKGKIIAVGPYTWHVWYDSNGNIDKFELDTEPGNQITIKDSLVNTVHDDITVLGADVTLEGAKVNSGKDIFVGAVNQYNSEKGVTTATSHDTSTLKADENTVINARGYAEAYGKILDIKARKFDNVVIADNPFIKVLNDQGLTLDKLADILKEHPEYENVISDILNTKYQIDVTKMNEIPNNIEKKYKLTREQLDNAVKDLFFSEVEFNRLKKIIDSGVLEDNDNDVYLVKVYNIALTQAGYDPIFTKELEEIDKIKSAKIATNSLLQGESVEQIQDAVESVFEIVNRWLEDSPGEHDVKILTSLEEFSAKFIKMQNGKNEDFQENFLDFTGSGIDLLKEFFDTYNALDDKQKDTVIGSCGESLGILSTAFDLFSSIADVTKNSETAGQFFGDLVSTSGKVSDLSFDIYKIAQGESALFQDKVGIWTPVDIYKALVKAGADVTGEAIRTIEKNNADNKWDSNDTADTLIRTSVTGLYSIVHTLSFGLDEAVYNGIVAVTGNKSDMPYLERLISGIEKGAVQAGQYLYNLTHK